MGEPWINRGAALQFLIDLGWEENEGGNLCSPSRPITDKEWDYLDFLVQECGFHYEAARSPRRH